MEVAHVVPDPIRAWCARQVRIQIDTVELLKAQSGEREQDGGILGPEVNHSLIRTNTLFDRPNREIDVPGLDDIGTPGSMPGPGDASQTPHEIAITPTRL